jgi:hypothetical protein
MLTSGYLSYGDGLPRYGDSTSLWLVNAALLRVTSAALSPLLFQKLIWQESSTAAKPTY